MNLAYEPSRSLPAKISRRVTPFLARRMLKFKLEKPLVSFTFDDCPLSAIENGVKPLADKGWKSTIYIAGGLLGETNHHGEQISAEDVTDLHEQGHEIGDHTFSHIDAQSTPGADFMADISRNQDFLKNLGMPSSPTFAYPYGQTLPGIKRKLEKQFTGLRGITPGIHAGEVDLNQIKSVPLFSGPRMGVAQNIISALSEAPAWVTFFTHDIREDHSPWGCSPQDLQIIMALVDSIGAEVLPVGQAIDKLKRLS